MSQDQISQESALKALEGDLEEARECLCKVTAGDYGLPNALDDIRNLKRQLAHLQQARTALIDEVYICRNHSTKPRLQEVMLMFRCLKESCKRAFT